VLTRILSLCGAGLPASEQGKAGHRDQHWEPVRIVRRHDEEILEPNGYRWRDVIFPARRWFESAEAECFRRSLAADFLTEFSGSRLPVLKDPRLCRLMPLWSDIFHWLGLDPRIIIAVRNPMAVASSLRARDRIPLHMGMQLWLRHLITAEHDTRAMRRCFISYEDLIRDPLGVVRTIDLTLALGLSVADDDGAVDRLVSPGTARSCKHSPGMPRAIRRTYAALLSACESQAADLSAFDEIRNQVEVVDRIATPIAAAYREWRWFRDAIRSRLRPSAPRALSPETFS